MSVPEAEGNCPDCRQPIPHDAPLGQCPRCLLGLANAASFEREIPDDLLDLDRTRHVGDYELIEEIARGGMGVVYRARQTSLGREVALKMLLAGELATPETVRRFQNEAAAAAKLDHSNIVPIYEIGEHETQHFFSMRLVAGRCHLAHWARRRPGEFRAIAHMMVRVAKAVAFAHDRGVLHRDLKPSNILVDEHDEPQITDFGLAKLFRDADPTLTQTMDVLGSPSYMAPEQAEGRHDDETTATDVYGLGSVLYEMLAGRPPFLGNSPLSTAKKVVEEPPPRLRDVPRDLETICLKCLAKDPAHRYDSAHALGDDLERFARGEPILARPMTLPEAVWSWARRRPKIAALIAVALLAFLFGFVGVTWQWLRAERANEHLRWLDVVRQTDSREEAPLALARLAAMLRDDPADWRAAMLAMSRVEQRAFPVPAGPPVVPGVELSTPPQLAPDGTWFAAGAEDGTLRVWDTATGEARRPQTLGAVAKTLVLGGGRHALALGTADGRVLVGASPGGPFEERARSGSGEIVELDCCADGSVLLARTADGVELWKNGDPIGRPYPEAAGAAGAALSADGRRLFFWKAKTAKVIDTDSGEAVVSVEARDRFLQGDLSGDGGRFALIDGPFTLRSWDARTGAAFAAVDSGVSSWRQLLLNADGSRLVGFGNTNDIILHDTVSGLPVAPPLRHLYMPTSLAPSGDGRRFASFGNDGRALVADFATGGSVMEAVWHDTDDRAAISLSADGSRLLVHPRTVRSGSPTIRVWRTSAVRLPQLQQVTGARDFFATGLSPDGTLGCLGLGPEPRTQVYEIATGRILLDAPTRGDVYAHLFSPDQRNYYAVTANGWLHGWELATGRELWPPGQQPGKVRPAAISPDGTRIVAGHNDGHLRIYDTATGRQVLALDHPGEIKVVRFAPDGGGRFLSASTDGLAHVWDLATGEKLASFSDHTHTIIAAAWSPDSRLVATASYDQTACVWDAATGKAVGRPMTHLAWLSHLEFSPDGALLATACRDGTARLWHPRSGQPASGPLPQASTALTVRFTRDSRALLVRDHLGFRFWSVDRAEPVTIHYPAPLSSGLGMDAETWRAILAPDGTGVHLGHSMNEGQYWSVPQTRSAVPPWFPAFLEHLAGMREGERGDLRLIPERDPTAQVPREGGGKYADWARSVLR